MVPSSVGTWRHASLVGWISGCLLLLLLLEGGDMNLLGAVAGPSKVENFKSLNETVSSGQGPANLTKWLYLAKASL